MTRSVGSALVLSVLVTGRMPTQAAAAEAQRRDGCAPITIRFGDRIPAGEETLKRAQAVVERVFHRSWIRIDWLDCSGEGVPLDPSCTAPAGPNDISLRIFQRSEGGRRATGPETGGITFRQTGGGTIHLFYDRLEELSDGERIPLELVLGITMAHEVGHLLLGHGHSHSGIMRPTLEGMDWHRAAQGWLLFNPSEEEIMRSGVCRRALTSSLDAMPLAAIISPEPGRPPERKQM